MTQTQSPAYKRGLLDGFLKHTQAPEWVWQIVDELFDLDHELHGSRNAAELTPSVAAPSSKIAHGCGVKKSTTRGLFARLVEEGTLDRWIDKVKRGHTLREIAEEDGVKEKFISNVFTHHNIKITELRRRMPSRQRSTPSSPLVPHVDDGNDAQQGGVGATDTTPKLRKTSTLALPEDKVELMKNMVDAGKTNKEISAEIGKSEDCVRYWLKKYGITSATQRATDRPPRPRPQQPGKWDHRIERWKQRVAEGMSVAELTKNEGLGDNVISNEFFKRGISAKELRASKHPVQKSIELNFRAEGQGDLRKTLDESPRKLRHAMNSAMEDVACDIKNQVTGAPKRKHHSGFRDWTDAEINTLMKMKAAGEKIPAIRKVLKRSFGDINFKWAALQTSCRPIGETITYHENGVQITKYPPGFAHGAMPQRNVKSAQ